MSSGKYHLDCSVAAYESEAMCADYGLVMLINCLKADNCLGLLLGSREWLAILNIPTAPPDTGDCIVINVGAAAAMTNRHNI